MVRNFLGGVEVLGPWNLFLGAAGIVRSGETECPDWY